MGQPRYAFVLTSLFVTLTTLGCDLPGDAVTSVDDLSTPVDVLGFESTAGWHVIEGHVRNLGISKIHTKGAGALQFDAASASLELASAKLAVTNPELAKIDVGASFLLDIMPPSDPVSRSKTLWSGSVELEIESSSLGLREVTLGKVDLTPLRKNAFSTVRFPISDAVAKKIKGSHCGDIVLSIELKLPSCTFATYRLDNLRVKGKRSPAPTSIAGIEPGQSILLASWRTNATPPEVVSAEQAFTAGVIQIPASFHVVAGSAGAGSATFSYRLGTGATVDCTYPADPASGGTTYKLGACAGGALAADLVPADWVKLAIVAGDPTAAKTKVRAQIALNPVGDELVAGLPSIPTYFGLTGADVAAALDTFVQAERNWQLTGDETVHLPTPAIPAGFQIVRNGTSLPTGAPGPNDPQFGLDGRLTGTDLADAGWHLSGSVSSNVDKTTGARDTHFDASAGADVWLVTAHISNVIGVNGVLETHTPAFDGKSVPPTTSTGNFCYQIIGIVSECAGPFDGTTGFAKTLADKHPAITLLDLNYWVFHVGLSGHADLTLTASGGFTPNGFAATVTPTAGVGVKVEGGLAVGGFLGGGIFADVRLIDVSAPIVASVVATLHAAPTACNVTLAEGLSGTMTLTTGGGAVGYYIEGGLTCGFFSGLCWRDEGNITTWMGASTSVDILPATPLASQTIDLPHDLCKPTTPAAGGITYPVPGESFNAGDASFLVADFTQLFVDTTNPITPDTHFPCSDFMWTSDNATDTLTSTQIGNDCYTKIVYGEQGTRRISVTASDPDLGTGAGSIDVTVGDGTLATAPVVAITSPAPFFFPGNCAGADLTGTATDPNGLDLTYGWQSAKYDDTGIVFTTLASTTLMQGIGSGQLARLTATNSAGQLAISEIPLTFECVK